MASLFGAPFYTARDATGAGISGAVWYFYRTGTTTPASVYSDGDLSTALGTSVTADSAGKFVPIYLDDGIVYRAILKDASANTIRDIDPVNPTGAVFSAAAYGARGDGTTDDTAALQAAIDAAKAVAGTVYIPANQAGQYYKTTGLVADDTVTIVGAGADATIIMGFGMTAGQYILDYDCAAIDVVENLGLSGLTLRSNNGLPHAMRQKNVSYMSMRDVKFFNCVKGSVITGTRTFSNYYENVQGYTMTGNCFSFETFTGGGHFTFIGCTGNGTNGLYVDSASEISQLALLSTNFEACTSHSIHIEGTVQGLSVVGCRHESGGGDMIMLAPASGKLVTGTVIKANYFTSNSAAYVPVVLGGNTGNVRGFEIVGNHTENCAQSHFVELNSEAQNGLITGNYFKEAAASPIDTQRAGVIVFGNQNSAATNNEFWGLSQWGVVEANFVPMDASGAGLGSLGAGRYTKQGRVVTWQASITYPVTASGANAVVSGFDFAVGGSTSNLGRAGANVNASDVGSAVGVLQGVASTTSFSFVDPTALTNITNATLSGKTLYVGGFYTI